MTYRNRILVGDVRAQLAKLPDESVHCVVTSPPYWGLRDYGADGQLGLEPTPEEFVCNLVSVFREVRRVLRKDGTVWLNLGDCYAHMGASGGTWNGSSPLGANGNAANASQAQKAMGGTLPAGLKPKDLVGQPWRVAFALQADGWWLRSDIIWSKPNPMPESVTDRPTKAHEYVFLLTKSERYYYDAEAIKERQTASTVARAAYGWAGVTDDGSNGARTGSTFKHMAESGEKIGTIPADGNRNKRSVWEIATQPYAEAHFATYPEALVKPCILAGTSEHGVCSVCGAPWRRLVEREPLTDETKAAFEAGRQRNGDETGRSDGYAAYKPHQERAVLSTRWEPTCKHEAPLARAVVLDPFMGSGTTGLVAKRAGRDYVGIELNETYAAMAERRIGSQGALL